MNSRKYDDRKEAKRVTRHPAYQQLQRRAAETTKDRDRLAREKRAIEEDLKKCKALLASSEAALKETREAA